MSGTAMVGAGAVTSRYATTANATARPNKKTAITLVNVLMKLRPLHTHDRRRAKLIYRRHPISGARGPGQYAHGLEHLPGRHIRSDRDNRTQLRRLVHTRLTESGGDTDDTPHTKTAEHTISRNMV